MFKRWLLVLGCSSFLFAFGACDQENMSSDELSEDEKTDSALTGDDRVLDQPLVDHCSKFRRIDTCRQNIGICAWKSVRIGFKRSGYCIPSYTHGCPMANDIECDLRVDTCTRDAYKKCVDKSVEEVIADPQVTVAAEETAEVANSVSRSCDFCQNLPVVSRIDEFCGKYRSANCPKKYCELNKSPWKAYNMAESFWKPFPHRSNYCVAKKAKTCSAYDNIECSMRENDCELEWNVIANEFKCVTKK